MHILIIPSEHFLTGEAPFAGIFQYHHAKLLKEKGHQVGVISAGLVPFNYLLKSYEYPSKELLEGIPIYRKYFRAFIPGRFAIKLFPKAIVKEYLVLFKKYISKHGIPDVIHAHNSLFAGAAAMKIKASYSLPFVITEHSSLYERGYVTSNQLTLTRRVMRSADARTVVSNKLGARLCEIIGGSVMPCTTIFNVLEESFILHELPSTNKGETYTFLSIGSLDENKNHASLIRAFASNFQGDKSKFLRIGGAGPCHGSLSELISELGLADQTKLCGKLEREEVLQELALCDAFVLPSKVETFGVVLIEALALGKPIISTVSGGPEDIVNELNGFIIPPSNDKLLAEAMLKMYENKSLYSERAIQIKEDCLSRFGRDVFYNRLNQIYKNIIVKN